MRRSLFLLLLFVSLTQVFGQEELSEEILQPILDEALQINITASVLPSGQSKSLNFEKSNLTIPGHPIAVRIKGENILIQAVLTLYEAENGHYLLVAQGQVWSTEPNAEKRVKYRSSLKSIPISLGEKVFFFPLGIPEKLKVAETFNIVLGIEVKSFKNR